MIHHTSELFPTTDSPIPENKEEFLKRWDALSEALAALPQDGMEIELPHQEQARKEDEFKASIKQKAIKIRENEMHQGIRDSHQMLQPTAVPQTTVGMRLDVLFNHTDEETGEGTLFWQQGRVIEASNRKNFIKNQIGNRIAYYKKDHSAMITWDYNAR